MRCDSGSRSVPVDTFGTGESGSARPAHSLRSAVRRLTPMNRRSGTVIVQSLVRMTKIMTFRRDVYLGHIG